MIRAVIDTSILVRAVLKPSGTVGPILDLLAANRYLMLYSEEILAEIIDVFSRPRLSRRFPLEAPDAETVIDLILLRGEEVFPTHSRAVCRDPKDDKFLDVAVEGRANVIVTGDEDLLVLHPYEGIPIVGAAGFLSLLEAAHAGPSFGDE